VIVTGKGGVGKSTVAAALALIAARRGKRAIVAEVAARADVSRTLAGAAGGAFIERVLDHGVSHISIDPQGALEEYLRDQLPNRALAELLSSSRMFGLFAAATPGMRELLSIGKVWELAQPDRRTPGAEPYDLVILDAPATGHGVAIIEAPRTFADAVSVGPVARQGRIIHAMLSDPSCTGVVAVARPQELAVTETLALRVALRDRMGLGVDAVVVNGMEPDRFGGSDVVALREAIAGAVAVGSPSAPGHAAGPAQASAAASASALRAHGRARAQRNQVARLRRGLGGEPVACLPFVFAASLEAEAVRRLSVELERRLP